MGRTPECLQPYSPPALTPAELLGRMRHAGLHFLPRSGSKTWLCCFLAETCCWDV